MLLWPPLNGYVTLHMTVEFSYLILQCFPLYLENYSLILILCLAVTLWFWLLFKKAYSLGTSLL